MFTQDMVWRKILGLFKKNNCPNESETKVCIQRDCTLYHNYHVTKNDFCYLDKDCYDKQCKYRHSDPQISKKICRNDFTKLGCLDRVCHMNHLITHTRNVLCKYKDDDKCDDESCLYTHKISIEDESPRILDHFFTDQKHLSEDEEEDEEYDEEYDDDPTPSKHNTKMNNEEYMDLSASDATSDDESFSNESKTPPDTDSDVKCEEIEENDSKLSFDDDYYEDDEDLDYPIAPFELENNASFQELFVGLANSV